MIAWVDLETTGLDPNKCGIIELACVVTNDKIDYKDEYESWVVPIGPVYWEDYARQMHIKSGLLEEWLKQKTKPYREVDDQLHDFLFEIDKKNPFFPGGSSVHFDMLFIKKYLPRTASIMSHRIFDVSSCKLLFHAGTGIGRDELPPIKSETAHRAMSDIQDSLSAAREYRDFIRGAGRMRSGRR